MSEKSLLLAHGSDSAVVGGGSFNILPDGNQYANSAVSVTPCVVVLEL